MNGLEETISIVTGASRGIGAEILRALARRGSLPVAAASTEERLRSVLDGVAEETGRRGSHLVFDGMHPRGVERFTGQVLDELQGRRSRHVYVVNAAGAHEPLSMPSEDGFRYSTADDFSAQEQGRLETLNVRLPLALYDAVARLGVPFTFLQLSSHAAGRTELWEQGNALYGPHKLRVEQELARRAGFAAEGVRVYAARYPFIDTDMADALLEELRRVEPRYRGIAKEGLFLPADVVAEDTADLLESGSSDAFTQEGGIVWTYARPVEAARARSKAAKR